MDATQWVWLDIKVAEKELWNEPINVMILFLVLDKHIVMVHLYIFDRAKQPVLH